MERTRLIGQSSALRRANNYVRRDLKSVIFFRSFGTQSMLISFLIKSELNATSTCIFQNEITKSETCCRRRRRRRNDFTSGAIWTIRRQFGLERAVYEPWAGLC